MNRIIVRNDEPFERALRRFKKACERSGIISDLRKGKHYVKPSEKRRLKAAAARRRKRKRRREK